MNAKLLTKRIAGLLFIFLLSLGSLWAQERMITGRVTDADDGAPLIGATVQVPGTTLGVITDIDGNYSIRVSEDINQLAFSYVGYQDDTVTIGDRTIIDVALSVSIEELEEVVVIGYGKIRKSDLTGSVASVKSEDIVKIPNSNPVNALQGKVAGLSVLSPNGDPGATPVVRLRGITTLNDNNPIFVVDGVITDDVTFLNPSDIESVEVLKDASSTAMFGSRGSNGVIIFTTKSGQSAKPRINVSYENGWETLAKKLDMMNRDEFVRFYNAIEPGTYNNPDVLPDIDWQEEVYQDMTPINNFNASASGQSERLNYYISGGYYSQEGIIPKSGFQRATARINTVYNLREGIDLGINFSISHTDKDNAPGVVHRVYRGFPIDAPYNEDGSFAEVRGDGNPLAAIAYHNNYTKGIASLGNVYAEINFLNDFTYKSSFQFDVGGTKGKRFTPVYYVSAVQSNDRSNLTVSYSDRRSFIFEQTLNYFKEFNEQTRLDVLGGFSSQLDNYEYMNSSTKELLREDEDFWYIDAGNDELVTAGNSASESALISYIFRSNFTLKNRYLFTATYRIDGSSKFGPENRYGHFPSGAVGWTISNEPFFPSANFIESVKLRASYGLIGNDKIDARSQYETIGSGLGAVFGIDETLYPGATFSSPGNPLLKWESTAQFNAGIDFDLFGRKLIGEFDYYNKNTEDILVNLSPLGWSGLGAYSRVRFNAANVVNSGFELKLDYRERFGDFYIEVGALGTTVRNEVKSLAQDIGADSVLVGGSLNNGQLVTRTIVGEPIGFFYGYEIIGVFQDQEQLDNTPHLATQGVGDFIYRDVNDDGRIVASDDKVKLGNSMPKYIYGFNFTLDYKGLSLNADFQGQYGNKIYNGKQAVRFGNANFEDKFNNFWTGPGSTNEHPKPTPAGTNYLESEYFVEDGSFLRLRTLTLSYNLPESVLRTVRLERARVYIKGTNLFTLTKFTGYSPEIGAGDPLSGPIDLNPYPITKVYSVGLNITL